MKSLEAPAPSRCSGFTLVELLVAMVVAVILMAIAVPSYRGFIAKQRVSAGQADLVALAVNLDGHLLNNTAYPAPATGVAALRTALPGWSPVQAEDFEYALVSVDNAAFPPAYEIQATGSSSLISGCVLTLTSAGARTKTGCPGGGATW